MNITFKYFITYEPLSLSQRTSAFTTRANHHHHHHHLWHHTCDQWNTNTRCYNTKNKDVRRFLSWHPIPSSEDSCIHVIHWNTGFALIRSYIKSLFFHSSVCPSVSLEVNTSKWPCCHGNMTETLSHTHEGTKACPSGNKHENTHPIIHVSCLFLRRVQRIHDLKNHPRIHAEDITQCLIRLCEYTVSRQRIVG